MYLQPRLLELLREFVKAYDVPFSRTGERENLMFSRSTGGTRVQHHGLDDRPRSVSYGDLEELDELGLIRISQTEPHSGNFRVTSEGYLAVEDSEQQERARSGPVAPPENGFGMEWATDVGPVLRAVYEAWIAAGASPKGVATEAVNAALGREDVNERTGRILDRLAEAKFVRVTLSIPQDTGPSMCIPTERTLQMFAGWPATSAEALHGRFLELLEERIADATDPDEQSRLKRLREAASNAGHRVISDLIYKVMTGGLDLGA